MSIFDHCLYFNISSLNRRITKIWEDEFGKLGLAPSHGYLLAALSETPELSHKQLSEIMELDPSTITRFLDKLEKQGLIVRSNKWKGASFQLTGEGKSLARRINKLMERLFNKMQDHFGKSDFSDMVNRLQQTRRSLE
jgi:DNA-binding MarR family transcriptional regulator